MRTAYILTILLFAYTYNIQAQTADSTSDNQPIEEKNSEIKPKPTKNIKGEGELGLNITSGNSDTENFNAKLNIGFNTQHWEHIFGLQAQQASDNDQTTAERYVVNTKSDRNFGNNKYLFGAFRYDDDRFSGFEYQSSITSGVGWRLIDSPKAKLDTELGIGYKESETDAGQMSNETIARTAGKYLLNVSETTALSQELLIESGEDNTFTESVSGIKVSINQQLAFKFSLTIKRNSNPPVENVKTDRITAVNLVYGF